MSMTADDLREILEEYPDLRTLEGAEELLRFVDSCLDMLRLYKHYFPDDFQSACRRGISLIPDEDHTYSECEMEFFALVDTHLFPLTLDWVLDDIYEARTFAHNIPIAPFGLDFEGDYGDAPLGWLLLQYLLGHLDEHGLRFFGSYDDDRLFEIPLQREGEISQYLLMQRCEAQAGPIVNFPYALEMLYGDTGTIWLDMSPSTIEIGNLWWTRQEIDRLHRQYLRAQDIEEKAEVFCAWLEEEPFPRFSMVVRLWKSCIRDTPLQESQEALVIVPAGKGKDGDTRHTAPPVCQDGGDGI